MPFGDVTEAGLLPQIQSALSASIHIIQFVNLFIREPDAQLSFLPRSTLANMGEIEFDIVSIDKFSGSFDNVLDIYEQNKAHLGFLPRGAFTPFVERNELLIACSGDTVFGYLMFRYSKANGKIRVTHLCVGKDHRGHGVATRLIEELKIRFNHVIRVTARCRKDFKSWAFWDQKSGFSAGRELAGRKKTGSILTEFFWEPRELPLFKHLGLDAPADPLPIVALDANVFFDLYDPERHRHTEANGILEDWLAGELDLCVTTELLEDVMRSNDEQTVNNSKSDLQGWKVISAEETEVQNELSKVEQILGSSRDPRSESDRRHLAIAIANGASAFVTRDNELLQKSELLFDNFGLSLYRPSQLAVEFDVIQDNERYQLRELERSGLHVRRFSGEQTFDFADFRSDDNDKVRPIKAQWNDATSNPRKNDVTNVLDSNGNVMAIAISTTTEEETVVSLLRVRLGDVKRRFGRTLIRYLLGNADRVFGSSSVMRFTDVPEYMVESFNEFGFLATDEAAIRISIPKVLTPLELTGELSKLSEAGVLAGSQLSDISDLLQTAIDEKDAATILQLEEQFSPLKIDVEFVPNYIVPIKPRWAKDLFDPEIGPQELWESPMEKTLNPRSVYYKASGGFSKELRNCRIIWYVSADADFSLAKNLRCSSIMTKRVTGIPNDLFRRFRRFGIYEFANVRDIHNKPDGKCEAIEFCATEAWQSPISYEAAIALLEQHNLKHNNFVTAQKIPNSIFLQLYQQAYSNR